MYVGRSVESHHDIGHDWKPVIGAKYNLCLIRKIKSILVPTLSVYNDIVYFMVINRAFTQARVKIDRGILRMGN